MASPWPGLFKKECGGTLGSMVGLWELKGGVSYKHRVVTELVQGCLETVTLGTELRDQ